MTLYYAGNPPVTVEFPAHIGPVMQTYSIIRLDVLRNCRVAGEMRPINTLRPRQNGRHFADDIFKCIFLNENVWFLIKISLNFVPKGHINQIPALVQIMAWRRPGDKPLSEPMMVSLPTYICVIRPQWVNTHVVSLWCRSREHIELCFNSSWPSDAFMRQ